MGSSFVAAVGVWCVAWGIGAGSCFDQAWSASSFAEGYRRHVDEAAGRGCPRRRVLTPLQVLYHAVLPQVMPQLPMCLSIVGSTKLPAFSVMGMFGAGGNRLWSHGSLTIMQYQGYWRFLLVILLMDPGRTR